jgi:Skp family chaperone for outer membrane proteins
MKKLTLVLVALFTLGAFTSNAQSIKLGHVSSAVVLDSVESYKAIVAEEQQIYKDGQEQSEAIQLQIQDMQIKAQEKAAKDSLSDFEAYIIQGDIEKKQQDLYQLEQYSQQQLQILNERLMKLMEMYKEAVGVVAKKYELTYVLDKDSQVLFAAESATDITNEVRTELLKMDNANRVHTYP